MKGLLGCTKVVVRHLPPTISKSVLIEHVDSRFSGRYRWLSFRPGKASQKHITYSRAYIDFNKPDDVVEFAEFFNGHVFVNEKGAQYKMIVEYAPSQRVPKHWLKNDGRGGTILKDPEYLDFLEFISKPVDNLPSAEIQLERKEAERIGAPKDTPIVTPLMDFIRQKRAARGGVRRNTLNGKLTRKVNGMLSSNPGSNSSKTSSDKRTSSMYVLRDSSKGANAKDKSSSILVSKQNEQPSDKSVNSAAATGADTLEGESGSGTPDTEKHKILMLKGKEKEVFNIYSGSPPQQNAASVASGSRNPATPKHNQRRESNGRIIRSILVNKDIRQHQTLSRSPLEQRLPNSNQDRDKKLPRSPLNLQSPHKNANGAPEGKAVNNELQTVHSEKHERRTRNKDSPDRGVWAPLQQSDGSHASDESLSSSTSQTSQLGDSVEELKHDVHMTRDGEYRSIGSGRGIQYFPGNGSFWHGGRRGSAYNAKDTDVSHQEGIFSKRSGSHDKQMWVQKSSPGS